MANQYFYLNTSNLATATKLYADMRGSTFGASGYYSNSTIWRYWTGTEFSNQGNCNTATNAPTPPPTSPPTSPPTPSPITPPPTPSPIAPSPTPSPTGAPTPPPTPAPASPTPSPTPAPVTPAPVTPPPTPAPVAANSYQFYGCNGGGGLLSYDGNLGAGVVVDVSGFGCATIFSTSTSSPSYYTYSEHSSCADCQATPSPTPAPVTPPPTPSPTPAPTSVQCLRLLLTQSSGSYPGQYTIKCCDGTWRYNQTLYGSTMVCSALTGPTYSSNITTQIMGACTDSC